MTLTAHVLVGRSPIQHEINSTNNRARARSKIFSVSREEKLIEVLLYSILNNYSS